MINDNASTIIPNYWDNPVLCARFAEVAEAEVLEGDVGEEVDSVEIRSKEYNGKGEKM